MAKLFAGVEFNLQSYSHAVLTALRELPDTWYVLLESRVGSRQVDVLIFTPDAIHVLEHKAKDGPIRVDEVGNWYLDTRGQEGPFFGARAGETPAVQAVNTANEVERHLTELVNRKVFRATNIRVQPHVWLENFNTQSKIWQSRKEREGYETFSEGWNLSVGHARVFQGLNKLQTVLEKSPKSGPYDAQAIESLLRHWQCEELYQGRIQGQILDAETKHPLEQVSIQVFQKESESKLITELRTNVDGLYSLGPLPVGPYTLRFSLPSGYEFPLELDIGINQNADVRMPIFAFRLGLSAEDRARLDNVESQCETMNTLEELFAGLEQQTNGKLVTLEDRIRDCERSGTDPAMLEQLRADHYALQLELGIATKKWT